MQNSEEVAKIVPNTLILQESPKSDKEDEKKVNTRVFEKIYQDYCDKYSYQFEKN